MAVTPFFQRLEDWRVSQGRDPKHGRVIPSTDLQQWRIENGRDPISGKPKKVVVYSDLIVRALFYAAEHDLNGLGQQMADLANEIEEME